MSLPRTGAGPADTAASGPTLQDTFTDTNGVSLDAHTPDIIPAGGWTEHTGDWDIQSNRADPSAVNGQVDRASADSTLSDFTIEATTHVGQAATSEKVGLIGRQSDATNFWMLWLERLAGADKWSIYDCVAGVYTQRATNTPTASQNTDFTQKGVFNGATIDAYLDGGSQITYASASFNQTATKVGLRSKLDGAVTNNNYVDDLTVT